MNTLPPYTTPNCPDPNTSSEKIWYSELISWETHTTASAHTEHVYFLQQLYENKYSPGFLYWWLDHLDKQQTAKLYSQVILYIYMFLLITLINPYISVVKAVLSINMDQKSLS